MFRNCWITRPATRSRFVLLRAGTKAPRWQWQNNRTNGPRFRSFFRPSLPCKDRGGGDDGYRKTKLVKYMTTDIKHHPKTAAHRKT